MCSYSENNSRLACPMQCVLSFDRTTRSDEKKGSKTMAKLSANGNEIGRIEKLVKKEIGTMFEEETLYTYSVRSNRVILRKYKWRSPLHDLESSRDWNATGWKRWGKLKNDKPVLTRAESWIESMIDKNGYIRV